MNTYDLNYPEQTRNIDAMLKIFTEERKRMIDNLLESPKKFKFNLVMDRNCCGHITSFKLITPKRPFSDHTSLPGECTEKMTREGVRNMGIWKNPAVSERSSLEERDNLFITSYFQCVQCRNMSRIMDLEKGMGSPFKIESGKYIGNYFILLKEPNVISNVCFKGSGNMKADLFSNNVLITWLLEIKLPPAIAKHLCKMHTAYICGNDGYYLYNHSELGSLNQLTETSEIYFPDIDIFDADFIKEYLKQIYVFLNYLGDNFIYGDLTIDSILFSFEETIYQWESVFINCPITLKFSNFKFSSYRISDHLTLSPHSPTLTVMNQSQLYKDILAYFSKPREFFILSESFTTQPLLLRSILTTHPKHFSSIFNLYSFLLLLLSHIPIRKTVLSSPPLTNLITNLFGPSFLTSTLEQHNACPTEGAGCFRLGVSCSSSISFEQILFYLTNIKMHSNAFDILLSFITQ